MASEPCLVEIWTDGGCRPNPGPGGWGAILKYGTHTKELAGAEPATTNNRMELTAAIAALSALNRPSRVLLHTDSQYLQEGITRWLPRWVMKGWMTAGRTPVKNADLWQALVTAMAPHQVRWAWVRGHAGNAMNERADRLASAARDAALGRPARGSATS